MVFLDTSAALTLPWLGFTAAAGTEQFDAVPITPAAGDRTGALKPTLTALIVNSLSGTSSVDWQVSAVSDFATTVFTSSQTGIADGIRSVTSTATLSNGTDYWWRVRAGDGAGSWGAWSAGTKFRVDTNVGRAYAAGYINYGREVTGPERATLSGYINYGVPVVLNQKAVDFMVENIGALFAAAYPGGEYMHWADVSSNTPVPHLWFLDPESGRSGDGFEVYCFGVGDLQGTYGGVLEVYLGPGFGWVTVPVVTWQTFPPTPDAYTADRILDPAAGIIDMQHTVVAAVIPAGLLPPGVPLRIRTEGP